METLKNILATIFITALLVAPIVLFTLAFALNWDAELKFILFIIGLADLGAIVSIVYNHVE